MEELARQRERELRKSAERYGRLCPAAAAPLGPAPPARALAKIGLALARGSGDA